MSGDLRDHLRGHLHGVPLHVSKVPVDDLHLWDILIVLGGIALLVVSMWWLTGYYAVHFEPPDITLPPIDTYQDGSTHSTHGP